MIRASGGRGSKLIPLFLEIWCIEDPVHRAFPQHRSVSLAVTLLPQAASNAVQPYAQPLFSRNGLVRNSKFGRRVQQQIDQNRKPTCHLIPLEEDSFVLLLRGTVAVVSVPFEHRLVGIGIATSLSIL